MRKYLLFLIALASIAFGVCSPAPACQSMALMGVGNCPAGGGGSFTVAMDAVSSGAHTASNTSVTDGSLTIGGSGTLLECEVAWTTSFVTPTSVTWNGTSMTAVPGLPYDSSLNQPLGIYYLLSPATGNHNAIANFASATEIYINCVSLKGGAFSGGTTTFPSVVTGTGNPTASGSLAVATASNDFNIAAFLTQRQSNTLSGTLIYNSGTGGTNSQNADAYSVPGTTPMTDTFAASGYWSGVAVETVGK
jgi:hypothetical protein